MTLQEAYYYGKQVLASVPIEDAEMDAWYLLEFVTGIGRTEYFLKMGQEMTQEQEERYIFLLQRRAEHIPLQHITGVQEFMGLEFRVNEHVLVPRQDTEILAEQILKELKPGMRVLDMCTGSGCILISLAKLGQAVSGVGVDISEQALAVAKENAMKHGTDIQLVQSDLFENVVGTYDVIVSNPPYIRTAVIQELSAEVKFHEPVLALDGKEDGLYFYRRIIRESIRYLKENGKLYFEIGHDQGRDVQNLMKEAGFSEVTVKKDLAGLDRIVFGVYS